MSLEKDIKSLVNSLNLELYGTTVVSESEETIYRISVLSHEVENGKRKGISLDACVELTHLISPLLDVTPPVSSEYRLEVGSPGIERSLNSISQFSMSIGEKISLLLKDKTKIKAKLINVEDSKIFLEKDGEESSLDYVEIAKAKTYFEW